MDTLAVDFLQNNGFETSKEMVQLFGSILVHGSQDDDTFDPIQARKMIRKQIANRLVYFLINPDKRPKEETAPQDEAGPDNGSPDETRVEGV